ncbi:MAG: DUF2298 domain-containing protein [Patescibacteria group bacterium]
MFQADFYLILKWWFLFFGIGLVFLPFTISLFKNFIDKGYIFSKVFATIIISYIVFILGILHIALFSNPTIFSVIFISIVFNLFFFKKGFLLNLKQNWIIFLLEEVIFFIGILFLSYVRSHAPDIHGLEKFMDFGFVNSILRADYFPPKDMWFTPFSINYYYFGHLMTAVLTKISMISSSITYNLMLSSLFAFTFTCSFSIGANLIYFLLNSKSKITDIKNNKSVDQISKHFGFWNYELKILAGGFLTGFLVSLSGNFQVIYSFFKNFSSENPLPFWNLIFSLTTFPNNYWYPNATRFIHNTIHEFPLYSFVVSDLHGHVLDIPVILLIIAILLSIISKSENLNSKQIRKSNNQSYKRFDILNFENWSLFRNSKLEIRILLLGFLLAVAYMTNAWDGLIYFLLTIFVFFSYLFKTDSNLDWKNSLYVILKNIFIIGIAFFIFTLPFNLYFKPFASGIGIICSPEFLINKQKLGPFLFEADHCLKSPWWQILILHGFFYFWVISFLTFLLSKTRIRNSLITIKKILPVDKYVLLLILVSTILVIIPEFFYIKDIYPAHYRANTMFKLTYQEFIMLSISSGYIIIRLLNKLRLKNWKLIILAFFGLISLTLVFTYPFFSIGSYYNNLNISYGLSGTKYLEKLHPGDYKAINWINENIKGQPVILEAQSDSYTDYARISSNTGLPTVLGWTVHEWLWRGSYDIPSPRINEIEILYNTQETAVAKKTIDKYNISYIYIGGLENQKYPNLSEDKFKILGKIIYSNNNVRIYKTN